MDTRVKKPMQTTHYGWGWLDKFASGNNYHPGVDYNYGKPNDDLGLAVYTLGDSKVLFIKDYLTWSEKIGKAGWGKVVVLETTLWDNNGNKKIIYPRYAHLNKIHIKVGDKLEGRVHFADCGKTGTTYPHLHFDIFKNKQTYWLQYPNNKPSDFVIGMYINPETIVGRLGQEGIWYMDNPKQQKVSEWAKEAWDYFKKNKIITQDRPQDMTTIEEVFIMLNRLGVLDNSKEPFSRERIITGLYRLKQKND